MSKIANFKSSPEMGHERLSIVLIIWIIVIIILLWFRRGENCSDKNPEECDCSSDDGSITTGPQDLTSPPPILEIVGGPNLNFKAPDPYYLTFGISSNCQSQDPWVYIHSGQLLSRVNVNTQAYELIGNMGREFFDVGFGIDGKLYGLWLFDNNIYEINIQTAAITLYTTTSPKLASNSMCGGPDGKLYGVTDGGDLMSMLLGSSTPQIVRSGLMPTSGDCVFFQGEFWWSGVDSRLYKIQGNVATGPIINVGPCASNLYGLASINCELWGFQVLSAYKIDPTDASISDTFSYPSFGLGYVQGSAKRDEAIQSGAYQVTINNLTNLPIIFTTTQTVIITFNDPNFTHQIVLLGGGSFEINSNYDLVNMVDGWIAN